MTSTNSNGDTTMNNTNAAGDDSPAAIVLYERPPGRWSAATSVGLLFYGVSRAEAENQLAEAGITSPLISVDGPTWQATWQSALSHELQSVDERLDNVATTEDVSALRQKQLAISTSIETLSASINEEKRRRDLADGEAELNRRAEAMFAQWPASFRTDPAYVALVWSSLRNSPLGQRIQELRQL